MLKPFAPLFDRTALVTETEKARANGLKIVLANGCFDLLHVGHVRYLEGAKTLGGKLIVAVNSDRQARILKGESRPFMRENERAELVRALKCVDAVAIFDEPTVEELIRAIKPDFHAKGTDYTTDSVPERETVRECGGEVAIVGDAKNHSTTKIIGKTRDERMETRD